MITTIKTRLPSVVGLKLTAKLHDEDYQQFAQAMATILAAEGKVRLFVQYEDFPGWDLYAAWEDFTLTVMHFSEVERIAMVGDRKKEKCMADFCKPFTHARVKYFDKLEVDAAWKWLEEKEDGEAMEKGHRPIDIADELDL